jgi:hypothetical protein
MSQKRPRVPWENLAGLLQHQPMNASARYVPFEPLLVAVGFGFLLVLLAS